MLGKLIGSPWALLAIGLLVMGAIGTVFWMGHSRGVNAERHRWEVRVEQARVARDKERRDAAEALSMLEYEYAEAQRVWGEKGERLRDALNKAIAENREAADRVIPDALLEPLREQGR